MSSRIPAEVFPPGDYVREEMDERGWNQAELAGILGVSPSTVTDVLKGRRSVTPELARGLEAAFGMDAEYWLRLDAYYRLHTTPEAAPEVAKRARLHSTFPVREMLARGWLQPSSEPDVIEAQVLQFYGISSLEEPPRLAFAARKGVSGSVDEPDLSQIQLAWLYRAYHVARAMPAREYSERKLRDALPRLHSLMSEPEEVRNAPGILEECGVRFVVVEPIPGSKIDGVCFWLELHRPQPVIGMTLRYDRIDNFWFVLRHEIEHVLRRDALSVDDMDAQGDDLPAQESAANEAAGAFCVPPEEMEDFILRVQPIFSERRIWGFAQAMGVHPGIVVGQLQKRLGRYNIFRKHLVKIREHLTPSAMTDGYGKGLPELSYS